MTIRSPRVIDVEAYREGSGGGWIRVGDLLTDPLPFGCPEPPEVTGIKIDLSGNYGIGVARVFYDGGEVTWVLGPNDSWHSIDSKAAPASAGPRPRIVQSW